MALVAGEVLLGPPGGHVGALTGRKEKKLPSQKRLYESCSVDILINFTICLILGSSSHQLLAATPQLVGKNASRIFLQETARTFCTQRAAF